MNIPRIPVTRSLRLPAAARPLRHRHASTAAPARIYTDRKAILYQSYAHILDHSPAILLFQPNNLTMAELGAIRRALAAIPSTSSAEDAPATLLTVRTGILSAVTSARPQSPSLAPLLSGPLALVHCPHFSPARIGHILAAINKALGSRVAAAPSAADGAPYPVNARMMLLGGIFDAHTVVSAVHVAQIAKLPEMSTLRAQLVGLLGSAGAGLVGTLQSAAGGSLVRTLQGLENDLKAPEDTKQA